MKKLFYLSLLFVVNIVMSLPLVAQEDYSYVPLLTEGKSWLWVSQNDVFGAGGCFWWWRPCIVLLGC